MIKLSDVINDFYLTKISYKSLLKNNDLILLIMSFVVMLLRDYFQFRKIVN